MLRRIRDSASLASVSLAQKVAMEGRERKRKGREVTSRFISPSRILCFFWQMTR